jgi:hypothetical protein
LYFCSNYCWISIKNFIQYEADQENIGHKKVLRFEIKKCPKAFWIASRSSNKVENKYFKNEKKNLKKTWRKNY